MYDGDVTHDDSGLIIDGKKVAFTGEMNPGDINWGAIIGGICGPLFGILGYASWRNEQNKKKSKKSDVMPAAGSAVAQAEASAKV